MLSLFLWSSKVLNLPVNFFQLPPSRRTASSSSTKHHHYQHQNYTLHTRPIHQQDQRQQRRTYHRRRRRHRSCRRQRHSLADAVAANATAPTATECRRQPPPHPKRSWGAGVHPTIIIVGAGDTPLPSHLPNSVKNGPKSEKGAEEGEVAIRIHWVECCVWCV